MNTSENILYFIKLHSYENLTGIHVMPDRIRSYSRPKSNYWIIMPTYSLILLSSCNAANFIYESILICI